MSLVYDDDEDEDPEDQKPNEEDEYLRCYTCGIVIHDQFDHNRDCPFSPEYVAP